MECIRQILKEVICIFYAILMSTKNENYDIELRKYLKPFIY